MNVIDYDTVFLPKGYTRKEFIGRPGLAKSGKIDAFYYDPNGQCIKSKIELQKSLGNKNDLSILDFRTGKISQSLVNRSLRKAKKSRSLQLQEPIRQQQVLVKQKVNCLKTQPNSKVNQEIKPSSTDRTPRQLFWEKRLSVYNENKDNQTDNSLILPKNIKLYGPETDNSTAIRSIASALQSTNLGIVGQTDSKVLDKNPCVFINPDQPLVQALVITDDDIRKQEERVLKARKQLESAYKKDKLIY